MLLLEQTMTLGERVRELRLAAGMTQDALTRASGLSLSLLTHLEQGVTPDPRWSTICKLADGLGVPVAALRMDDQGGAKSRPRGRPPNQ